MSKLLLLYCTLLVGLLFVLLHPATTPHDLFLFADVSIGGSNYLYLLCERLVLVVLSGVIANEATEYRSALWVFFWLMVLDVIDFILIYNLEWFYIGSFPVTFNVIKSLIFGGVILKEIIWKRPIL